ncbi:Meiotic recombination protein rec8 [Lachnellula suecica]|uniref:Meiotic recombination protein rec8 n=1 Tax=Lachnellula suecica TaxID=602035 RepID=A0A8T9C6L5_9HELO|nr:Meiotic recombination protein rec8 [Lachnellula suecica]
MFYSHEILTSRKYGVATIWLVATLGKSSSTRKLTRKAITDVDVQKACGTIMEPEAPMALRLQSNLMYGVARVYSQQCTYVLSDAQAAQTAMRAMLKAGGGGAELDSSAGKARPEQLVLMDDPAFLVDMALPPLEFERGLSLDPVGGQGESQRSMMSVGGRSGSVSSNSLPPLNLGSSSGNSIGYQLPFDDPFAGSAQKAYIGEDGGAFGEEMMYQDDMFEFDGDGNMVDIPASERLARRSSAHPRLGSDSAASGRVRREHEDGAGHVLPLLDGEGDFDMLNYDDGELPDAEAFPSGGGGGVFMTGALQGNDKSLHAQVPDLVHSHSQSPSDGEPSSISAEAAPLRKTRKPREVKKLGLDTRIELRNNDMISFRDNYADNMAAAAQVKMNHKAAMAAKKNAFHYVYGTGLMNIGNGLGSLNIASPLDIFAGAQLLEAITGPPASSSTSKRPRSPAQDKQTPSPKRPRHEDEVGRAFEDDAPLNFDDDNLHDSIELGRDAPPGLPDYPSSALMPWNISASARASSKAASRRMTSASPLVGRGSALPSQFDILPEHDDEIMYGRDDVDVDGGVDPSSFGGNPGFSQASSHGGQGFDGDVTTHSQEFELFGPAAAVDTQTAGTSQWVRQALDRESGNFFEFVRNSISEKVEAANEEKAQAVDELGDEVFGGIVGEEGVEESVTFEELFDTDKNSCMVAAQAFYHVLCLATKRRVWVVQEEGVELGREIRIGVVDAV